MSSAKPLLNFGKESTKRYQEVNDKVFGNQLSNKELFMIALAIGVHHASKITKFDKAPTGPRTELTDSDLHLLDSVALMDSGKQDELPAPETRNETAIQYAEGGIRILHDLVVDKTPEYARSAFINEFRKSIGR